jgi:hypothetical protein
VPEIIWCVLCKLENNLERPARREIDGDPLCDPHIKSEGHRETDGKEVNVVNGRTALAAHDPRAVRAAANALENELKPGKPPLSDYSMRPGGRRCRRCTGRLGQRNHNDIHDHCAEAERKEQAMEDVAAIARCKCSPQCTAAPRPGKEYAWGHSPRPGKMPRRAPVIATAVHNAAAGASSLPWRVDEVSDQEYRFQYAAQRFLPEEFQMLQPKIEKLELGRVLIIHVTDKKECKQLRDKLRRAFDNWGKQAGFGLEISQNVRCMHIAIKKTQAGQEERGRGKCIT